MRYVRKREFDVGDKVIISDTIPTNAEYIGDICVVTDYLGSQVYQVDDLTRGGIGRWFVNSMLLIVEDIVFENINAIEL